MGYFCLIKLYKIFRSNCKQLDKILKKKDRIFQVAVDTLENEADSIRNLVKLLDENFTNSVLLISETKGRVIITGIGKSAIVGNKIVSTMNSTGTPAIFMHAADAVHGDLGTIQQDDIVICISNSGSTPEIKVLVPLLKAAGNKLVAMTGNTNSFLAENADFVLNTHVDKEACPNNLAPTSSTTAQMAMGDALAVCLLDYKGFSKADFAKFHPGGALGKQLYMKVGDFLSRHGKPEVGPEANLETIIFEITSKRLGATAVIEENKLAGIITDGDLRRMLQQHTDYKQITAASIMSKNPRTIDADIMAVEAFKVMKEYKITQLVVLKEDKYAGFIHMHDLLQEGLDNNLIF